MGSPAATTAIGAIAAVLGATYLNGKYAISQDVRTLLHDRAFRKRIGKRVQVLGDEVTLYHMLELADPDAEALWFEGRVFTYANVKKYVDQLAWALHGQGVREGHFVAVFMTNSPEMVFTILAVTKLGAVPAMLNAALRSETLLHCIRIATATFVVSTPDLADPLADLMRETEAPLGCITLNLGSFVPGTTVDKAVQVSLDDLSHTRAPASFTRPKRALKDLAILIYTSGTTGKPKAVSVKNNLIAIVSTPLSLDLDNPQKYRPLRTYSPLPLFHGTCFFSGMCHSIGTSSTFCLGRKFSASRFFQELTECQANRMLYVGELCRYLIVAPPSKYDKAHSCIVAAGNGLQKDVWEKFKARYGISEIREVYRSTEGIAKFDNFGSGPVGAGMVGFAGPLGRVLEDTTYLVRYDHDGETLYRDPKTGFCVLSKLGEPGEAIGRVRSMDVYSAYLNNPDANSVKLARDVFQKGDLFQRTGDLLVRDRDGWVRFHDRTGDTFRWKGENVSEGEVREFISQLPGVHDAVVYGIKLPGYDGQAGAAAITLTTATPATEDSLAASMYTLLRSRGLPTYAVPRLVRFKNEIPSGHTFKHAKDVLKKLSWHPAKNVEGDRLYWLDGETYRELTEPDWMSIEGGKAKL